VTMEYMLYQALLGAWPAGGGRDPSFPERFQAYALKAAREAKAETSWLNPIAAYEEGLRAFIDLILDPAVSGEFLSSLDTLAQRLALLGALNSLSQVTLKATLPGVPDFYQGTELWDLSLVDPDNRRPVDFAARARMLASPAAPDWARLAKDWRTGELKFAWTRQLLRLRNEHPKLFTEGDYQPLDVSGPHREHIIAFARRHGRDAAIIVVARSLASFTQEGRAWPRMDALEAVVNLRGFSLEGKRAHASEMPVSSLLKYLPAMVVRAQGATSGKIKRVRQGVHA
jgi:(1->4)-alpha-D-glucan 1-alpha-D-glucosylmutase